MHKQIGDEQVHEVALETMREKTLEWGPDVRWAAYQNHELGHPELGHMKFLAVGPGRTYETAPAKLPDSATEINWRYIHVGYVDLESGKVV